VVVSIEITVVSPSSDPLERFGGDDAVSSLSLFCDVRSTSVRWVGDRNGYVDVGKEGKQESMFVTLLRVRLRGRSRGLELANLWNRFEGHCGVSFLLRQGSGSGASSVVGVFLSHCFGFSRANVL